MAVNKAIKEIGELYLRSVWKVVEILDGTHKGKIGVLMEPHVNTRHAEVSCRIVCLHPTHQNIYLESWNKSAVGVRIMEDIEVRKVLPKLTRDVMQYLNFYGGTIGADPEIFVVDKKGQIIPAFEFLPDKNHGTIFWDGFQAEFTMGEGRTCLAYMVDDIRKNLMSILRMAQDKFPKAGARLTHKTVLEIPHEVMVHSKPEHVILGCAPSKNIYSEQIVCSEDPSTLPFRFAGSHVHLGFRVANPEVLPRIVRAMDLLAGLPSVSLLDGLEDPIRRKYYGRAGEYRLPAHGLEYRTLSSAMLAHPAIYHLLFDLARAGAYLAMQGVEYFFEYDDDVEYLINRYQVKKIRKLLKENANNFHILLDRIYGDKWSVAWELLTRGVKKCIPTIEDIESNWMLSNDAIWHGHSDSSNACIARVLTDENHKIVGATGEDDDNDDYYPDDDDYDEDEDY